MLNKLFLNYHSLFFKVRFSAQRAEFQFVQMTGIDLNQDFFFS